MLSHNWGTSELNRLIPLWGIPINVGLNNRRGNSELNHLIRLWGNPIIMRGPNKLPIPHIKGGGIYTPVVSPCGDGGV